jgi:hypothetical protein
MDNAIPKSQERTKKRWRETADRYPEPHRPGKRRMTNADSGTNQPLYVNLSSGLLSDDPYALSLPMLPMEVEGASRSAALVSMQPTPKKSLSSNTNGPATPTIGCPDFSTSSSFLFSHDIEEGSSSFSLERIRAPIFRNVTIPPLYSFPSNNVDGCYPTVDSFASSSLYTLPGQVTENLGGVGQISNGQGKLSY